MENKEEIVDSESVIVKPVVIQPDDLIIQIDDLLERRFTIKQEVE